jgi:hypothetical protein
MAIMLKHQPLLGVSILLIVQLLPWYACRAFSPLATRAALLHTSHHPRWTLLLESSADKNEGDTRTDMVVVETPPTVNALGPATTIPTAASDSSMNKTELPPPSQVKRTTSVQATQIVMLTNEMKRILIEELGYTRKNVETMRVELGQAVIEKRTPCPSEGMPESWCDSSLMGRLASSNSQSAMRKRLEDESKYPLKVPLLGMSLVLFGKGLSDAGITIIKVNSSFPGASLTEEFMGVPVLAIDFVCMVVGISVGVWTWKTMRDE